MSKKTTTEYSKSTTKKHMAKYIAKPDTWFDEGTECELLVDCRPKDPLGVFRGLRTANSSTSLRTAGEKYVDEETCNFDEFEVVYDGENHE